jgi:ankyrin repeat protein
MTPGMTAALNNRLDVLKYLAQNGSTFQEADDEGDTILHKAAINSNKVLLQYLVEELGLK